MGIERYSIAGDYFIHSDENGAHVKYTDYAELERQRDALLKSAAMDSETITSLAKANDQFVAENAALKAWAQQADELWTNNCDLDDHLDNRAETKQTDAALREIGARAVEAFAECAYTLEHHDHAMSYAQQLREGKV